MRLIGLVAGGIAVFALLALVLFPRPSPPGTALVVLSSAAGDRLAPVDVGLGATHLTVSGDAPRAPDSRNAVTLTLAPGDYPVSVAGTRQPVSLSVRSGQVEPLLLAVAGGRVAPGGAYAGVGSLNLGLQELSGRLTPMADFHLLDQAGRPLDRASLLGQDTVIAAFHTTCRESCPLYTGLMFQLRRSAPGVRLVEVTTDPATDVPRALADYRTRIGADWTFATGDADALTQFWAPFGVALAVGDTHSSALALVDRHGFIRAAYTGVPDVGGRLPGALDAQLDGAGRQLLAGHGEGWGAPQVLDTLRGVAQAQEEQGGRAPAFSLRATDGRTVSLEELRGRPVVLNFWYAGCPPCRQEMPLLQAYADRHPEVALVLVDRQDAEGTARAFAASAGVHAPVLIDADGRVTAAYRVAAFPTTVFIRPDGGEASRLPRAVTAQDLDAHISNLGAG